MEDKFYKDDFEAYLSKQADKYKMYPADKVWGNIHDHLHQPTRWPQMRITGFVLLVSVLTGLLLLQSENQMPKLATIQVSANNNIPTHLIDHTRNVSGNVLVDKKTDQQVSTDLYAVNSNRNGRSSNFTIASDLGNTALGNMESNTRFHSSVIKEASAPNADGNSEVAYSLNETDGEVIENFVGDDDVTQLLVTSAPDQNEKKLNIDMLLNPQEASVENDAVQLLAKQNNIRIKKASQFSVQIYASPSISYRQLVDNTPKDAKNAAPIDNSNILSINKLVNQTPSIGFEAGVAGVLQYNKKIKFKLGAQFNYRSYKIDAFTIKDNNTFASANISNTRDEKNVFALNRTGDEMYPVQLQNQFFEISAPVGVEYLVTGNKRLQFSVGASFQPTLLLNKDAYVVTTNFRNYEEQPNVMRHFNLNTSLEAFMSYNVGGLTLQAGPQVRYQLLSTYKSDFHLNEKLIDFGFKIGVTKRLK